MTFRDLPVGSWFKRDEKYHDYKIWMKVAPLQPELGLYNAVVFVRNTCYADQVPNDFECVRCNSPDVVIKE